VSWTVIQKVDRNKKRKTRHLRVRKKVFGTAERPRLNVFRSAKNIYAQLIDDSIGHTVVSASTLDAEFKAKGVSGGTVEAARLVGELIAKRAIEKGYKHVVFDRGGYLYHGRVKALADGAREGGLDF
jgi:large subunit ribosomal protein L18